MRSELIVFLFFTYSLVLCDATSSEPDVEPRGKKKKIALFVFFADMIIKKLFVVKLVFAFLLWLLVHKAGYLFSWFISYLHDTKHTHDHHDHHEHWEPPHHHYGAPPYASSYGPYKREAWGRH